VLILFVSYTDFMVYEVKKDGSVIHLTDFEEPKPKVRLTLLSWLLCSLPNLLPGSPQTQGDCPCGEEACRAGPVQQ
jgi:hypothetical protein